MKPGIGKWILLGLGALALAGGGTVALVLTQTLRKRLLVLMPFFRAAAAREGVPLSWLIGIAAHESRLNPMVVAGKGTADERRGGSYGVMQMSYQTAAQDLGYAGPKPSLDDVDGGVWKAPVPKGHIMDPETNIALGAKLIARLKRTHGNFRDVAAAYNSGRPFDKAPTITRESYVPSAMNYQQQFAPLDSGKAVV